MFNHVVLVGRLVNDIEPIETEFGKICSRITLAIPRNFKNEEGEYETDFVDIVLWGANAKNAAEFLEKGDLIGIKGRIQIRNEENENEERRKITEIVAEKVSFLSSKKGDEIDE